VEGGWQNFGRVTAGFADLRETEAGMGIYRSRGFSAREACLAHARTDVAHAGSPAAHAKLADSKALLASLM
jgi:hypothetical protein